MDIARPFLDGLGYLSGLLTQDKIMPVPRGAIKFHGSKDDPFYKVAREHNLKREHVLFENRMIDFWNRLTHLCADLCKRKFCSFEELTSWAEEIIQNEKKRSLALDQIEKELSSSTPLEK